MKVDNAQNQINTKPFSAELSRLLSCGELKGWLEFFEAEMKKEYFLKLEDFLNDEYSSEKVFPPVDKIFNAFLYCDVASAKVLLLGQDPYHEENQAMGLAFSVPKSTKIPPSLRNIFTEMQVDIGVLRTHGDISDLAEKGFFLLNTVLTVLEGKANSHARKGWETFTTSAVKFLAEKNPNVVFLLLGKPAEKFEKLAKGAVVKTSHPSPLSSYRGFFGSEIFSQINAILAKTNTQIDWHEPKDKT